MKTLKSYILTGIIAVSAVVTNAQTINWSVPVDSNKNIAGATLSFDYGVTYGLSYGRSMKAFSLPVVAGIEFSIPSGDNLIDDHKTKIGGQIQVVEFKGFRFIAKIQGIYRRYNNDFVRMQNFGSDLSGVVGYYKEKWFVAAEAGFDKAIVTHFKHDDLYKDKYEFVQDGWYNPSSGGNFYYGLQGGYNFKQHGIYLKVGKVITQDFKTKPMVPYFTQLGYTLRF